MSLQYGIKLLMLIVLMMSLAGCAQTVSVGSFKESFDASVYQNKAFETARSDKLNVMFEYDAVKNDITITDIGTQAFGSPRLSRVYAANVELFEKSGKVVDCVTLQQAKGRGKPAYSPCMPNTDMDNLSLFNKNEIDTKKAVVGTVVSPLAIALTVLGAPTNPYKDSVHVEVDAETVERIGSELNHRLGRLADLYRRALAGETVEQHQKLSPHAVRVLLHEQGLAGIIAGISAKPAWQVSKNNATSYGLLDAADIADAYKKRYLQLDYTDAFNRATTLEELDQFVRSYEGVHDPDKLVARAAEKLVPLLRQRGNFADLCRAFYFTRAREDFDRARAVMKGDEEQATARQLFAAIYQQELEAARTSIPSLQKFVATYPESGLSDKARQMISGLEGDKAWKENYSRKHDPASLRKFIAAHPHSGFVDEANKRIRKAELAAAKAKGVAALRTFAQTYPDTDEAGEAARLILAGKKAELDKARRGGIKGLLAFASQYTDGPELIEVRREIDDYVRKNVVLTGSDIIVADGDGGDAVQWGAQSSNDFLRTGDNYNVFIAGVLKNKSRETLRVKVRPTLHLVRTTVVRLLVPISKTTPVNIDRDYFVTLRPGAEEPFLVLYKNISSGVSIGSSAMIGGSSSLDFAAKSHSISFGFAHDEPSSSVLSEQHSLLTQFARHGNIKTEQSFGQKMNRFFTKIVGGTPDSRANLHVYYETKTPGDGIYNVKLLRNGVALREQKTEKGSIGVKTSFYGIDANDRYEVEIMGARYPVSVKDGVTQFYVYKHRTKTEYQRM